jgi:hypothetical protein
MYFPNLSTCRHFYSQLGPFSTSHSKLLLQPLGGAAGAPSCNRSTLHRDILFCPLTISISPSLSGGVGLFEVYPYSLVEYNHQVVTGIRGPFILSVIVALSQIVRTLEG